MGPLKRNRKTAPAPKTGPGRKKTSVKTGLAASIWVGTINGSIFRMKGEVMEIKIEVLEQRIAPGGMLELIPVDLGGN